MISNSESKRIFKTSETLADFPLVGVSGYIYRDREFDLHYEWDGIEYILLGLGGSASDTIEYVDAGHPFVVGDAVYPIGPIWATADVSDRVSLGLGVITAVNGDNFSVSFSGVILMLSHGYAMGTWYIDAAGKPTLTEPSTVGTYKQIAFEIVDADNILIGDRIAIEL